MTSVMAFAWALEPSADNLPAGQDRLRALGLLPGSERAGSFVRVGSEPHAVRLRVARAARAASWAARELTRRFMVMRVLHRRGVLIPLRNPEARCAPGMARRAGIVAGCPDAAKVRASRVLMDV